MKKILLVVIVASLLFSCADNKEHVPDVSSIKVKAPIERFDIDFFAVDTVNPLPPVSALQKKYPSLVPIFVQHILGLDETDFVQGVRSFINLTRPFADSINLLFANTSQLQKDFEDAFRYVKYYFPDYKLPRIYTVIGPIDALARRGTGYSPDFLGPNFLGISLQFYLGKNFALYQDQRFIDGVAPLYRSRRFSKEYIVSDAMQLITDDIFRDSSSGAPLIEQIVEKGKQWWLLDKLLPYTADSLKTGYTQEQLNWCKDNEGMIWAQIIKSEDIYSINNATIQTYIGEGPFTQGFPQDQSPGNIGQWIGWQMVAKFAKDHPSLSPKEVMLTPAKTLFDEAKYKPK